MTHKQEKTPNCDIQVKENLLSKNVNDFVYECLWNFPDFPGIKFRSPGKTPTYIITPATPTHRSVMPALVRRSYASSTISDAFAVLLPTSYRTFRLY